LYWAGLTSFDLGEAGRSLLWWEPLINEYPRSRFTPEVLFLTAEIYADRGERRRSLELYDRLVAAYPDSPRTVEADRRRRTLRLELDGLSAREAELWVALESATDTPEPGSAGWFDIVLELGRIAIREQITLTVQRSRIVEYLLRAGDYTGAEAAEASVLLAEYYRRRGETRAAVERYVQAAATPGAPDELRAQSLFELAVLARDRGDTTTARDAVRELSTRYPDSIWSDRAQSVLEDD
jgi:TolA-binding protein